MSRPDRNHGVLLQEAVRQHRAGAVDAAKKLYEQVLRGEPKNADALQMLGLVLIEGGTVDKGFQLLRRAVAYAPRSVSALNNLAIELCKIGRPDEALPYFDKLLQFDAAATDVHYNRARAYQQLGRSNDAKAGYERVLALQPGHPGALINRGVVLHELGQANASLADFDAAVAAGHATAEAHYNRGLTLHRLKRFDDAVESYDRAIAARPAYAEAFYNRGLALQELDRLDDAIVSYDAALGCKADLPDALNNRGNAQFALRRFTDAAESFQAALALRPDHVDALFNLGNTLRALRRPAVALEVYEHVLSLAPDHAAAMENRASVLLDLHRFSEAATAFADLLAHAPDQFDALGRAFHARLLGCDWTDYDVMSQKIRGELAAGRRADVPFMLLAHAPEAELQCVCARAFAADKFSGARPARNFRPPDDPRIRLAYLSSDFREHAVCYLLAGVFERHDRSRFETVAISFQPPDDSSTGRRVAAAFDHFVDVSALPDRAVAELMRKMGVDVAVDLMGYTANCRTGIFVHRGAPVQVNYLGYPGTMGADCFDYIIADDFVIPAGSEVYCSEKIVRLPNCFQANDDGRSADPTPTREQAGLPEAGLVFCCFNGSFKLNPTMFRIWMRLLAAIPDSVLWLVAEAAEARSNLRAAAAAQGVDAARLIFAALAPYPAHLARLRHADLFLDTLPFNAGTTASDALWAGVPVITCAGEAFAGRMAGSLLRTLGLAELVTTDLTTYEALALSLALNGDARANVRARLAGARETSPLFDTNAVCRDLEAAFSAMVARQRRGEPPASFRVDGSKS